MPYSISSDTVMGSEHDDGIMSQNAQERISRVHESDPDNSTFTYKSQPNVAVSKTQKGTSVLQPSTESDHTTHLKNLNRSKLKQRLQIPVISNDGPSSFSNRLVLYFGKYKAALESNSQEVGSCVEQFVLGLMKDVTGKDKRFGGRLRSCESYYEGLKIKHPNEFDYFLELSESSISIDDIDIINVIPDTFTPRKYSDIYGRSYFKAFFKGIIPNNWHCDDCKRESEIDCLHRRELKARQIQLDFCEVVQKAASELDEKWQGVKIQCTGPAVTIYTKLHKDVAKRGLLNKHGLKKLEQHADIENFIIKIHIALAIPIKRKDAGLAWPLGGYENMDLNEDMVGHEASIRKCHLVTAGDFWKVSFSHYEASLMQKLTENPWKKHCFQALKYLRDQVGIANIEDNSLLCTYPLKVSFLMENKRHEKDEYWRFWSLSDRIRGILANTESGGMISYFIQKDPVSMEADHSHIESRRIVQYLDKMECHYHTNGMAHFVMMTLLLLSHVSLLALSGVFLNRKQSGQVNTSCIDYAKQLESFALAHLPLSLLSLFISGIGAIWIIIQRLFLRTSSVLYEMYRSIVYVYLLLTAIDAVLVGFGIGIAVTSRGTYNPRCTANSVKEVALTFCTICLSALVVMTMLIHTIIYLISVRGKVKQHRWEIVFSDFIYREAFPCLIRSTRDPPRVSVSVNKKENVADDMDSDSDYNDITDGPISTLERNRNKLRRVISESTNSISSSYQRNRNSYESPSGRFDPISPMRSLSKHSSFSEHPHSPTLFKPTDSGELGAWLSPGSSLRKHNALPPDSLHLSINGQVTSATLHTPRRNHNKQNGLNRSYSSLPHSRSSTPTVLHLTTIDERTTHTKPPAARRQILSAMDAMHHSYEQSPGRHTSEPCLIAGYSPSETGSLNSSRIITSSLISYDKCAPVNTRCIDVAI